MYKERTFLTEEQKDAIRALKGAGVFAVDVADRFGCSRHQVHGLWQGRKMIRERPAGRLTDAVREQIIEMRARGETNAATQKATGFSECTIRQVLAQARDEGDMRAHPDPAVRRAAQIQREAASAAHRKGGATIPERHSALAPNSIEASLIMRGMRPALAAATAKAWRNRQGAAR